MFYLYLVYFYHDKHLLFQRNGTNRRIKHGYPNVKNRHKREKTFFFFYGRSLFLKCFQGIHSRCWSRQELKYDHRIALTQLATSLGASVWRNAVSIHASVPTSLFLGYASIKHLSKQPLNSLTPEQYELNHWFNNILWQASKRVPELINQPLPAASGNMLNIFILHRNQSSNKFQHSTLRASLAWWSFRINKLVFQADLNDKTSY